MGEVKHEWTLPDAQEATFEDLYGFNTPSQRLVKILRLRRYVQPGSEFNPMELHYDRLLVEFVHSGKQQEVSNEHVVVFDSPLEVLAHCAEGA